MSGLDLRKLTPHLGAEVFGDGVLAAALDDPATATQLRQAFLDHHVLAVRGQDLDREQHKALGRLFGDLHIHPSRRGKNFEGDREIFPVAADENSTLNNGGLWHSDVSCDPIPPLGSILRLVEAPTTGGDTLFANMHLAYETLSGPVRAMLDGLDAVHDQRQDISNYGYEIRAGYDYPRTTHPMVVAHPETGRPLLFANPAFTTHIEGLSARESRSVLHMLHEHVAGSPSIQCRVRWEPGTVVFWDNRCVQHYAVWDYRPERRRGERVTIQARTAPARVGAATSPDIPSTTPPEVSP